MPGRRSISPAVRSAFAISCRTCSRCCIATRISHAAHILRAAGRQFAEGDVQHWWHEPGGEGVRTRIQDDRLWLVYAALEYARVTGDRDIFDETAPLHRAARAGTGRTQRVRDARSVADRDVHLRPLRACHRPDDGDGRSRPAADGHRRLERRDGRGRCRTGRGESVWLGWFLGSLSRRSRRSRSTRRRAAGRDLSRPRRDG